MGIGAGRISRIPGLLAVVLLVVGSLTRFPYAFYVILRFVVCGSAAYTAVWSYQNRRAAWTWVMGGIAAFFNPFVTIRMSRSDWVYVDVASAVVFGIWFVSERVWETRNNSAVDEHRERKAV